MAWNEIDTLRGSNGSPGAAATVSIGTVSALPAGAAATVTNTGTSSAAVLNFGIPTGATGATGPSGASITGPIGATGAAGTNATTTAAATASVNGLMAAADKSKLDSLPVIQRVRMQTTSAGLAVFTFPVAFASGVIPVISVTPEDATAGVLLNHKITAKSNAGVTVQVDRSVAVTILGISVLGVSAAAATWVHITATAP